MIIYIGSTRPAKVEAVRDAMDAIAARDRRFGTAEIRPIDLSGTGPPMPMSEAAILDGARRRAARLIEGPAAGENGERFAVGLEGGLDRLPLDADSMAYALKAWACVTDGRRWSYGAGGAVVVPAAVARDVLAGRELGDVIDALAGGEVRGTRGGWGLLTSDLVGRREAFRVAVISAFAPFYNPTYYS